MAAHYTYNCTDKSIVLPYYKKYYVSPLFRFVPGWLTANFITLISTGFIFIMVVATLLFDSPGSPLMALISAVCLNTYVLGDHLDGMQAKHTGTSSPLGEFLDHHLDVYNGAAVFFSLIIFLGPVSMPVFLLLMVLNCFAFAATMVEEMECRMLVFGYLGTLEGVLILIVFYLTWLIPAVRNFWQQELIAGYAIYWIILIGLGLGYLGTIIDILIRMGRFPLPFAIYCLITICATLLLAKQPLSQFQACLILILFSADYIARVMQAYFLNRPHPYPDPISSALFIAFLIAGTAGWLNEIQWQTVLQLLTAWLLVKAVLAFSTTVYRLRGYWYWVNPGANCEV